MRSGLLLDDAGVLHAMERGERPPPPAPELEGRRALGPVARERRTARRAGEHVRETLRAMAREIRSGSIQAVPAIKASGITPASTATTPPPCRFAPGEGGDRRRPLRSLKAERVWELLLNGETAPREGENEEGGGENA